MPLLLRFRSLLRAHPTRSLAALAALVVAVQCHPVIFFGKSFVSPDNGALLLYDGDRTFPTSQGDPEDTQASDVGAMMWWHLYCPVLTHDALWRDHELPLWNRYSLGGVPLLGQGQSMAGDPLNWLGVLARGAAWSWDARFVLARWLLGCGLGLTAWALTGDLAASALVVLGAGFLGMFGFRLNHAANFSLGYAPWILFAWTALLAAPTRRSAARACLVLLCANFAETTSGTVKEASMYIACLNLAGLLLLALDPAPLRRRLRLLAGAAGTGLAFVLVTAPWWRTFRAALKHSWTNYDHPLALHTPPARLIGFFDDLFSRQFVAHEHTYMPAVNFLFLGGVLWALAGWRDLAGRRGFVPIVLATAVPLALAFGGVPHAAVESVPFLANLHTLDITFSCVLIVPVALLAGYGFSAAGRALHAPGWRADYGLYLLLLGLLGLIYLGSSQEITKSPFFLGYAWSLVLVLIALPVGLRLAARKNRAGLGLALLLGGAVILLWRHGQYLRTPWDAYVFNPQARMDLRARSPAIAAVEARLQEPSRPLGFDLNLFAGYNEMLGWESILGVDPLRNRYFDDLTWAFGIERVRNADQPVPLALPSGYRAGLDLLTVRYYLALPRPGQPPIAGLQRLGAYDFDVYESPSAWPRAFFTDRLGTYDSVEQFASQVTAGDGRPFAAVQRGDATVPEAPGRMSRRLHGRTVAAASDYKLTTNTTAFDVQAPSAGVIVLSENYYPYDFRVRVNGHPEEYFRINHAFKGVYVDRPGKYRVEFEYWPRSLNLSLQLGALGLLGVGILGWIAVRRELHQPVGPPR